ncbi:MAG: peptide chain release factor N(5)-glutamine methyltransferase [Bacteroidota bacterium]|nr:peptide chain release factor N(5)-glutamine methyltransferase [Bacteroidota bacterium]
MQNTIPVTLLEFLNYSTKLLNNKNIKDSRLNVELMLCDVLKCERMNLYMNFEKPLSKEEIKKFKEYLKRRLVNEPLQYILGKTSFYGLDFVVNKNVLIPRPETELIVEKILAEIKISKKTEVTIFEIGCGSGCISIALAKNLELEHVKFNIFSIDISRGAVEVANQNLRLNNLENSKVKFYSKDVFEIDNLTKAFDYIASNPPYIPLNEFKELESEVKDYEPDLALTDFGEGIKFFEKIFSIAADKKFIGKVFCEIGFGQRSKLEALLSEKKFTDYSFHKDYNGIDRILEVRK